MDPDAHWIRAGGPLSPPQKHVIFYEGLDDGIFLVRVRPSAGSAGVDRQRRSPKEAVNIRLDPEVLAYFRATGPGWQSRINEALRKAAGL